MKQIEDFGDDRNKGWCVYCGGPGDTRDHVPSKVLLDQPLPEQLPVLPACTTCNREFSRDESYFACVIECALTGSVNAAKSRGKVRDILDRSPALAARLDAARYERNGESGFNPELDRVQAIILKLARGHAAFENNEPRLDDPETVRFAPFASMTKEDRERFEAGSQADGLVPWPEVGSRTMTRMVTGYDLGQGGWITVQPDMYRYRMQLSGGLRIQIVVREYLAAEIIWD